MVKKKREKGKRLARPLDKMARLKNDPILPVSFSLDKLSHETYSSAEGYMSNGKAELARLKETWAALMTDMNKLALDLQGQSPWMTRAVEQLRSSTREMNNDLMAYVEDSYGHMIKLQGMWMARVSAMGQNLMNAALSSEPLLLGQKRDSKCRSNGHRSV